MILLDTQVLVWWVSSPEKLSAKAEKIIEKEKKSGMLLVSSISVWEIYLLVSRNKLHMTMDIDTWIHIIENVPFVQFVPVDNTIASKSVLLPGEFHKDPADRIIVVTSREKGVSLVTSDEKIRKYPHVQIVW